MSLISDATPPVGTGPVTPAQAKAVLASASLEFTAATIDQAIDRLGVQINAELDGQFPVFVAVMHGGLPFASDLLQRFTGPVELAYLHVSRYGAETTGSELRWLQGVTADVQQRNVLLIDDVLDQGVTMRALRTAMTDAGAASVKAAVLVHKDVPECVSHADYIALHAANEYLFGRGMDYAGYWRNLRSIHSLNETEV